MSSNLEIERKFLIRTPPAIPRENDFFVISQGYITSGGVCREVRLRRFGERYTLGVKSGGGVAREETEVELTRDQFYALWPLTEGWRLEKVRYLIPFGSVMIELDVYSGKLEGLIVAEVEFESIASCEAFVPPGWFDREISDNPAYKNSRLANQGLPRE